VSCPWVLMYHRVCERDASTKCWFERGTAVTPAALDRQLAWLLERFDVVPLEELHEPHARANRSRVALTFDDGYADTLSLAAPICARRGVVATCFASAGPAMGGPPLWFDVWYSLVYAGLGQAGWSTALHELGIPESPDIESCVRGPAKRWLSSLAVAARRQVLDRLASALGVPIPHGLHLDIDGMRRLRALSWRIGGHGVDHIRLNECDPGSLQREVRGSLQLLAEVGGPSSRQFAYPDGALSNAVLEAISDAGFTFACTVRSAPWSEPTERLAVPRLFARGDDHSPHPALANAS
jgi:peptidoglycan/xylan/chitin deacetylase (PgdA/CDA1 family)